MFLTFRTPRLLTFSRPFLHPLRVFIHCVHCDASVLWFHCVYCSVINLLTLPADPCVSLVVYRILIATNTSVTPTVVSITTVIETGNCIQFTRRGEEDAQVDGRTCKRSQINVWMTARVTLASVKMFVIQAAQTENNEKLLITMSFLSLSLFICLFLSHPHSLTDSGSSLSVKLPHSS